jgi:hypothetical protein
MAAELPYLPSYKNVDVLFQKIASAKVPEAFTHKYLYDIIGLKSIGDRALIPLLRTLGFLDGSNKPTEAYAGLKNPSKAPFIIAQALRTAYEPLFAANESAHALNPEQLKGLIAQVAGTDSGVTAKIAGTFNALVKLANFGPSPEEPIDKTKGKEEVEGKEPSTKEKSSSLRPEFQYNIQIHLPSNASEETYLNIFNALRRAFK